MRRFAGCRLRADVRIPATFVPWLDRPTGLVARDLVAALDYPCSTTLRPWRSGLRGRRISW
jgi:hypothetical protein